MSQPFDMQKAREICDNPMFVYPNARVALRSTLDEIERLQRDVDGLTTALAGSGKTVIIESATQAKRIAELEATVSALRSENCIGCVAKLEYIDKQRSALKKLGKAKRERGKALVEERIWHFIVGGADECIVPDEKFPENWDCYCVDAPMKCPANAYLREVAREQLRREGKL